MQASCKASETLEVKDGKFLVHFSHSSSHAHSQSRSILERFTASYSFMLCCLSQPQQLPKWASVHFIAWPEKKGVFLTIVLLGYLSRQNVQAGSGRIDLALKQSVGGLVITLPQNIFSPMSNLDIAYCNCKGTKLQVDYE